MLRPRNRKRPPRRRRRAGAPSRPRRKGRRRKPRVPPEARRARARLAALVGLLVAVNVYVFFGREGTNLAALRALPVAATGVGPGRMGTFADPSDDACGAHPVRIFDGLARAPVISGEVGPARPLRIALLESGVRPAEVAAVEAAMRPKVDLSAVDTAVRPFRVAVDRTGGVLAWEIEWAEGHLVQGCRRGEGFEIRHVQQPFRSEVEAIGVELGRRADLVEALAEAGESFELADAVAGVAAYDLDVNTETRPGDRLQVLVEKRHLGDHFHRYGTVLAVRYLGSLARFSYYRHRTPRGEEGFYDRDGRAHRRALRRSPVGRLLLSPARRTAAEPRVEVRAGVPGFVYRLPEGAPVLALGDGHVVGVGADPDLGRVVEVEVADGMVVRYGHLGHVVAALERGTKVAAGDLLGFVGQSGDCPVPQLRLELWRAGPPRKVLDPAVILARREGRPRRVGAPLPEEELAAFRDAVRPWARALRHAAR